MKRYYFLVLTGIVLLLNNTGCKKKEQADAGPPFIPCMYNQNSTVSYSATILPILNTHCNSCHTYPGSGGIDLNYFNGVKNAALSGQLVHAMQHDTSYVIMPPPPAQSIDTCQRYAIKRWIIQGCPNN